MGFLIRDVIHYISSFFNFFFFFFFAFPTSVDAFMVYHVLPYKTKREKLLIKNHPSLENSFVCFHVKKESNSFKLGSFLGMRKFMSLSKLRWLLYINFVASCSNKIDNRQHQEKKCALGMSLSYHSASYSSCFSSSFYWLLMMKSLQQACCLLI